MVKVNETTLHDGVRVIEGDVVFLNVNENSGLFSKMFNILDDVRPIIISNTEEIEVGDKYIDEEFTIKTFEEKDKLKREIRVKVIAFPENFSEQHYRDIKNKKIKDGDVVLVECIRYNSHNTPDISQEELDTIIKLNENNHITIYPSEVEPSGWVEVSSDLKEFCDKKGYTSKPLNTVMPMIIQYLDKKYFINKKKI